MVTCQFALYPLRTERVGQVLEDAINEIETSGLTFRLGGMSTEMQGDEEQVFAALAAAFKRAAAHGDVVLVATVSNACG